MRVMPRGCRGQLHLIGAAIDHLPFMNGDILVAVLGKERRQQPPVGSPRLIKAAQEHNRDPHQSDCAVFHAFAAFAIPTHGQRAR